MKKNAGIKPIPNWGASRISSPRLIAILSSIVSFSIVVIYFGIFSENDISEIGEKKRIDYLSRTPEHVAESFVAAVTEKNVERALKLCKSHARQAILDGSVFRFLTRTGQYRKENQRIGERGVRRAQRTSIHSIDESRKPVESTPPTTTTRSVTALDQSTVDQNSSRKTGFRRAESKERNRDFESPEPLVFSVREYHKKGKNRVRLIGASKSKNTDRAYFRNIEVTVERSDSRWYVSRIVFE